MDDGSSGWFLDRGVGADTDTRHFASWSLELGLLFPLLAIPRIFYPFWHTQRFPQHMWEGFHELPMYDHDDASSLSFVDLATTR